MSVVVADLSDVILLPDMEPVLSSASAISSPLDSRVTSISTATSM